MIGMSIYGGTLLAELSLHPRVIAYSTNRNLVHRIIPFVFILTGLFLAGYPNQHADWTPWSNSLRLLAEKLFHQNAKNFWPTLGVQLTTLGIILSSSAQHALSHRILTWLGNISFPVYLIHGPLLRSALNWMLFAFSTPRRLVDTDAHGTITREYMRLPKPSPWHLAYALPLFFALLLALAHLWTLKVEPWCAWLTKVAEDTFMGKIAAGEKEERPTLLPVVEAGPSSGGSPYSDTNARSLV